MQSERINAEFLTQNTRRQWANIQVFERIDSTNTYLKSQSGARVVCLAEQQTGGRGRHGNQWQSPDAQNIYLSYSWQFETPPDHLGLLSLWVGIVLAKTLETFGLSEHGIKWPNDVYWRQRKMGGILIEGSNLSPVLVVGIGLNINMDNETGIDQPWVSLSEALDKSVNRNHLLIALLDALYEAMEQFVHLSPADLLRGWHRWDLIRDHAVSFMDNQALLQGRARGVSADGKLLVELPSGELRPFSTAINTVRWT